MNLSCFELQTPIEISEGKVSTLILENPTFYGNFIRDLLLQANNASDRFILFDEQETLNFSKITEIITDVFSISFDSRQIANKINQAVSEEYRLTETDSGRLLEEINAIAPLIVSKLDFDAVYEPLTNMDAVLKLFNFAIDSDNLTFFEKVMSYLDFSSHYLGKKLFVILNLKLVLSAAEFAEFVKWVGYKKLSVLLVERFSEMDILKEETVKIIDRDLCEL